MIPRFCRVIVVLSSACSFSLALPSPSSSAWKETATPCPSPSALVSPSPCPIPSPSLVPTFQASSSPFTRTPVSAHLLSSETPPPTGDQSPWLESTPLPSAASTTHVSTVRSRLSRLYRMCQAFAYDVALTIFLRAPPDTHRTTVAAIYREYILSAPPPTASPSPSRSPSRSKLQHTASRRRRQRRYHHRKPDHLHVPENGQQDPDKFLFPTLLRLQGSTIPGGVGRDSDGSNADDGDGDDDAEYEDEEEEETSGGEDAHGSDEHSQSSMTNKEHQKSEVSANGGRTSSAGTNGQGQNPEVIKHAAEYPSPSPPTRATHVEEHPSEHHEESVEEKRAADSASESGSTPKTKSLGFHGVPDGIVAGENVTQLSLMTYKIARAERVLTLAAAPCYTVKSWLPAVAEQLRRDEASFNLLCVDTSAGGLYGRELKRKFDNWGKAHFIEAEPEDVGTKLSERKVDMLVSWMGIQRWGTVKSWSFFKGLRRGGVSKLLLGNNGKMRVNSDSGFGQLNVRKAPFLFQEPSRVVGGVTEDDTMQLLFYKVDKLRDSFSD